MSRGKPVNLTIAKIDAMERGEEMWDAIVTGLHVRAGTTGKSFMYAYKSPDGRLRRPSIGKYGPLTLDKAKTIAREWAGLVAEGKDPLEIKQTKREEGPPATVQDMKDKYDAIIERAVKLREDVKNEYGYAEKVNRAYKRQAFSDVKPNTIKQYVFLWNHILAYFGPKKTLASITKEDIHAMHEALAVKKARGIPGNKSGGYTVANRTVAFLSTLLMAAATWKMIPKAMAEEAVEELPQYKEFSRDRALDEEEIDRFLTTTQAWRNSTWHRRRSMGLLAELLLFSGCRCGEIMASRLKWVDFTTGTIRLPDSKTGAKILKPSQMVLDILAERHKEWVAAGSVDAHDWIVPGKKPHQHLQSPNKGWHSLLEDAKIENFRIHDLRHTFATIGVSHGVATLDQMGRQLHQSSPATTQRYAHAMVSAQRKVADDTVEAILNMRKKSLSIENVEVSPSFEIIPSETASSLIH